MAPREVLVNDAKYFDASFKSRGDHETNHHRETEPSAPCVGGCQKRCLVRSLVKLLKACLLGQASLLPHPRRLDAPGRWTKAHTSRPAGGRKLSVGCKNISSHRVKGGRMQVQPAGPL